MRVHVGLFGFLGAGVALILLVGRADAFVVAPSTRTCSSSLSMSNQDASMQQQAAAFAAASMLSLALWTVVPEMTNAATSTIPTPIAEVLVLPTKNKTSKTEDASKQQVLAPKQQIPAPKEQAPFPKQQVPVLKQQAPVPKEQAPVPKQQALAPKQKAPVPKQQVPVPKQQLESAKTAVSAATSRLVAAQKEYNSDKSASDKAAAAVSQAARNAKQAKTTFLDANDRLAKARAEKVERTILQQQKNVGKSGLIDLKLCDVVNRYQHVHNCLNPGAPFSQRN